MRLLFLSNFYPPHSQGGYEQLCREIAHEMFGRGHEVMVLTSGHEQTDERDGPVFVRRGLPLEVEGGLAHTIARLAFGGHAAAERWGVAIVEQSVAKFAPDAALVWGMWNIPRVVPSTVERLLPTAYYFCDYWPTLPDAYIQRLREPAKNRGWELPKKLVATWFLPRLLVRPRIPLVIASAACVSNAVRDHLIDQGINIHHAHIIRNGIRLDQYVVSRSPDSSSSESLRLVYSGRVAPDKGIHTAIDAIRILAGDGQAVLLDILGSGDAIYTNQLMEDVRNSGMPVSFLGFLPRERIPTILANYDAFIFPSEWEEPLARAVIEAMAAGLAVIGTTTGGTGEVLRDGETGLTFDAGDAAGLARQIERLAADPELRARLAAAGREVVMRDFNIAHTVDQLEALLIRITRQEGVAVA